MQASAFQAASQAHERPSKEKRRSEGSAQQLGALWEAYQSSEEEQPRLQRQEHCKWLPPVSIIKVWAFTIFYAVVSWLASATVVNKLLVDNDQDPFHLSWMWNLGVGCFVGYTLYPLIWVLVMAKQAKADGNDDEFMRKWDNKDIYRWWS